MRDDSKFRIGNCVKSIQINPGLEGKVTGIRLNREVEKATNDYSLRLYPDLKYWVEVEFTETTNIYGPKEFKFLDKNCILGPNHLINYETKSRWLPDKDLQRINR